MDRRARHPWVDSVKGSIRFGLQAVAAHSQGDKGAALIRAGEHADRYGFDAFFLGDHPAWAPECWLHLAVLAARTRRVRLGQMVAAVPYRTPLMVARLQSDLDRLSGGRSILGLGIGWNAADYGLGANEFDRMGIPYPAASERQAALEEALAIIAGLWGPEPFSFSGAYYSAAEARVDPPLQEPGPPIVIAGGGQRTLDQVARLGDVCNFGPGPAGNVNSPADAREKIELLRRRCDAHGRSPDDILRSHFTHWLILTEREEDVAAKVARYFPGGLDPFWGAYLVAGTPEQAAAHFQAYVDAGIEYFVVQTLDPDDEESIALTIEQLQPRLESRSLD
jgi:alkanesulfonate monooxygenase SsuD/methylene tetrahydromethanopterin reductase-like flavin-dependent oxidoreductase (luciferase family)